MQAASTALEMLQQKNQQQEVSMGPGRACALHPRGGLMWKEHHLRTPIIDQRHQREKHEQQAPSSTVSPTVCAPPPAYRLTTPPHPANGRVTSSSPKPCGRDRGEGIEKSGEMLFYYFGGGGEEENYGGGEINPRLPRVEKLSRLHFPSRRGNREKSPPWAEKSISLRPGRSLGGYTSPPGHGKRREQTLSGEFPPQGESGVSAGPRPLRWSEPRGRREKKGPASPETVGRIGGRRGGEKRKAGRNLLSPSPAT